MHKVVNANNALKLNEYQGTYEIVGGNVSDDGKFWMNWTIASEYDSVAGYSVPVKKDDGKYRNTPVKVILGDKAQAIENLRWLLGQLEGYEVVPPAEPESYAPITDDEVPF
jgi:hypothetical protein